MFDTSDAHQTGIRNVLLNKKFPENKLLTQFFPSIWFFLGCVSRKTIFTYTALFTRRYCAMLSIVCTHTHAHACSFGIIFIYVFGRLCLFSLSFVVHQQLCEPYEKFLCLTSDILFKHKLFACTGTEQSDVRETYQSVKSSNICELNCFFFLFSHANPSFG